MSSKVIDSIWFTENLGPSIGIVKVATEEGNKFYIGRCTEEDEKKDEQHIAKYGGPVNAPMVASFLREEITGFFVTEEKARRPSGHSIAIVLIVCGLFLMAAIIVTRL